MIRAKSIAGAVVRTVLGATAGVVVYQWLFSNLNWNGGSLPSDEQADFASVHDAQPNREASFLNAIDAAREAFASGITDLAKASARPRRAAELCRVLGADGEAEIPVGHWLGTIKGVWSTNDGRGGMSIMLDDRVAFTTQFLSLPDPENTTMDPASAVYSAATLLQPGQRVRFSGDLFGSKVDCINEISLFMDASINDPVFEFRPTALAAVP